MLSCDWGTSQFRLRLAERESLQILGEYKSAEGIQSLAQAYADVEERKCAMIRVLISGIKALEVPDQSLIPLAISGMASSNLGWQLLPYAELPAAVNGSTLFFVDVMIGPRRARLISGLQTHCDVMRGEETELVGLFADLERPQLRAESTVILPGTHSKHVHVKEGYIVDFTTHQTGEIYHLLRTQSTLRSPANGQFDQAAFIEGIETSRREGLSAALFQTRARTILKKLPTEHSDAFLSGVLIGAEVQTLVSSLPSTIVLAAPVPLVGSYQIAVDLLLPKTDVIVLPPDSIRHAALRGHVKILDLS